MTDLAVHDGPIFPFTMADLAVHDGPIFAFTMVRNSQPSAVSWFPAMPANLHREINFEDEICQYLGGHGWQPQPLPSRLLLARSSS